MKQKTLLAGAIVVGLIAVAARGQHEIRLHRLEQGRLGFMARDVTQVDVRKLQLPREAGVYVEQVAEDTAAAEADLHEGDVILEYAGLPILSVRHFQRLISDTPPARKVELSVFRSAQQIKKTITVGKQHRLVPHPVQPETPRDRAWDRPGTHFRVEPDRSGGAFFFFSERPRLGITGGNLTEQLADFLGVPGKKGVLVVEVLEKTPAKRADLRAGDVIISIDGRPLESLYELSSRLREETHELGIVRDKMVEQVTVQLEPKKQKGTRF
ncbi:PDZ domain-containing protein [Acidobacteria bacterium AH-259-G07]|nr:PDZ domain-containing protein [Acidobacteria bacterium AH-259-G07]